MEQRLCLAEILLGRQQGQPGFDHWYDKAKNYRQFEFIWDPSKEPINGGAAAGVIGVPPAGTQGGQKRIFGTQGGNSGFGQQPTGSPTGNPGSGTNPPPVRRRQGKCRSKNAPAPAGRSAVLQLTPISNGDSESLRLGALGAR